MNDPDRRSISRRHALASAGGILATAGVAGCLEEIPFLGDEALTFSASQAWVPEATLASTDYEESSIDDFVIERTFEAAGQTQDVEVTNWLAEYDRSVEGGFLDAIVGDAQAAIFVVLSTPQVSVLDRTFNPVGDMNADELLELVQDHYDGLGNPTRVGGAEATLAGEETTIAAYETEADLVAQGVTVDLMLHVAEAVEVGGDFIVAIGGYPTQLGTTERDRQFTMAADVEHEG